MKNNCLILVCILYWVSLNVFFLSPISFCLSGVRHTTGSEATVPKTAFTSDTNFRRFLNTTHRFDNLLENLVELPECCYPQVTVCCWERVQKISQRNWRIEQSLGSIVRCPQDVLSSQHRFVTIHVEYCQSWKLTWASVFTDFIGASLCRHDWLIARVAALSFQSSTPTVAWVTSLA